MRYALLLRGVNVGGKNKIAMSDLKTCLEKLGFTEVSTLLNSGNAVFSSTPEDARRLAKKIEKALIQGFQFDSELIRVLVLSREQLGQVIESAPKGFGSQPELYHSDVAFLIEGDATEAMKEFTCHPEVDTVWAGEGAVFYQRLSSQLTKSRLSKILSSPIYKLLTIRTWNTVNKLYIRMNK